MFSKLSQTLRLSYYLAQRKKATLNAKKKVLHALIINFLVMRLTVKLKVNAASSRNPIGIATIERTRTAKTKRITRTTMSL